MTPRVLLVAGTICLATGAGLAWSAVRSEREFRRLLAEGDAAVARHQTLEAIEAFSGAVALRHDSMVAHFKRGDSYRARGDHALALRDLRTAVSLDATAPQPLELLADVNADMGRHERAVELYTQSLALDERAPRVLYKLALATYHAQRPADAIAPLRRALALDDQMAEAHYLLGICLREQGQSREGLAALRRAVALAPSLVAAREALADAFRADDRRREHLEQLEALAVLEPERPARLVGLAVAYATAGRTSAALTTLDRLEESLPRDAPLRAEVARAWLTSAPTRTNRSTLERARSVLTPIAARPDAPGHVLALLGKVQLLAGETASAERTLQRAVARVPVHPTTFLDLADAAERRGHPTAARSALIDYTALIDTDGNRAHVAHRIAVLSLQLGDPATALDWAQRATSVGARVALPELTTLAAAELQLGHRDRARATIARGLRLNPRYRPLLALRQQLAR